MHPFAVQRHHFTVEYTAAGVACNSDARTLDRLGGYPQRRLDAGGHKFDRDQFPDGAVIEPHTECCDIISHSVIDTFVTGDANR